MKSKATIVLLTLIFQLVADHVMRTHMESAPAWFPYAVAASMGLVALLVVKIIQVINRP